VRIEPRSPEKEAFVSVKYSNKQACDVEDDRVAFVAGLFNFPQYGHTMFNGVGNIFATMNELGIKRGEVVLLVRKTGRYMRRSPTEEGSRFLTGPFESVFRAIANETKSLSGLLRTESVICFSKIIIGFSTAIDHYNPQPSKETFQEFASFMKGAFQSFRVDDCKDRVVVVSRPDRAIINEREIVFKVSELLSSFGLNYCLNVTAFEKIEVHFQINMMTTTRLLFGVDGTGLMNSAFMAWPCGVLVHLRAYGTSLLHPLKGSNFRRLALLGAGFYLMWENRHFNSTILNKSKLSPAVIDILQRGDASPREISRLSGHERHVAVLCQHTYVSAPEILSVLERALQTIINCRQGLYTANANMIRIEADFPTVGN